MLDGDTLGIIRLTDFAVVSTDSSGDNDTLVLRFAIEGEVVAESTSKCVNKDGSGFKWSFALDTTVPMKTPDISVTLVHRNSNESLGVLHFSGGELFATFLSCTIRCCPSTPFTKSLTNPNTGSTTPLCLSLTIAFPSLSPSSETSEDSNRQDDHPSLFITIYSLFDATTTADFDFLHATTHLITHSTNQSTFFQQLLWVARKRWFALDDADLQARVAMHAVEQPRLVAIYNSTIDHLRAHPEDDDYRQLLQYMIELAVLLHDKYVEEHAVGVGKAENLHQAITVLEDALAMTPVGDAKRGLVVSTIELCYDTLGEAGAGSDLRPMPHSVRETVMGYDNWSSVYQNMEEDDEEEKRLGMDASIGVEYLQRYEKSGDPSTIDVSISHLERGIVINQAPTRKGKYLYLLKEALARALLNRYERFGSPRDLDRAIEVFEEAMPLMPGADAVLQCSNNLAAALVARFSLTKNMGDVDLAIQMLETVALETVDGQEGKVEVFGTLGTAYGTRFKAFSDPGDFNKAIAILECAVVLDELAVNSTKRKRNPVLLHKLAVELVTGFHRLGREDGLHLIIKAIDVQEKAIMMAPQDDPGLPQELWNVAHMYLCRHIQLRGVEGQAAAAADGDLELAIGTLSIAARMNGVGPPSVRFLAATTWAGVALESRHKSMYEAHRVALEILPQLAWLGSSLEERHRHLVGAGQLVLNAAALAVAYGNPEEAVEWLEQGRSVVWGGLLHLRTSTEHLKETHPNLANRFVVVSKELERDLAAGVGGMRDGDRAERAARNHRKLTFEWEKVVGEIRALPGYKHFSLPKKFAELRKAAAGGPVVILNASALRCDALILLPEKADVLQVRLKDCRHKEVAEWQKGLEKLLMESGRCIRSDEEGRDEADRFGMKAVSPYRTVEDIDSRFSAILSGLWVKVVHPVITRLSLKPKDSPNDLPRIWWCPTGPFSSLPIHAAGDYSLRNAPESRLSQFAISSYIPTLSSLLRDSPIRLSSPTTPPKILAIAQSKTLGQHDLPGTLAEVRVLAQRAAEGGNDFTQLLESEATPESVKTGMQDANWVHFACHGVQDVICPSDSALLLSGSDDSSPSPSSSSALPFLSLGLRSRPRAPRLRLSEIIKLSLPEAHFAFLSACQTARGVQYLPDESVHLAGGMLMAGYRGVVGSLWSIGDGDATEVADCVYEILLGVETGDGVSQQGSASQDAQGLRWLTEWLSGMILGSVQSGKRNGGRQGDYRQAAYALHCATEALRERYEGRSFIRWVPFIHIGA